MPGLGPGVNPSEVGSAVWWAALQEVPGVGPATMLRLARAFGSAEAAAHASAQELVTRAGLSEAQAEDIAAIPGRIEHIRRRIEGLACLGIRVCAIGEAGYPPGLLALRTPPPLIYLRGELRPEDTRAVAVVGTRNPNARGRRLARELAQTLAARGVTVVSGLARGIDTAAHRGALAAPQGRTIAVLGCGLLRVYPPENSLLAARIARRGCLISELPPETEVDRRFLLARDRLQAALSLSVIVVQAHAECGSIITARHARRCGRRLFASPWEDPPFREGWEILQTLGAERLPEHLDPDELVALLTQPLPPEQQSLA